MMSCNDLRLRAFLTAPEESGLFRDVSRHVEECPRCCQRLLELSGDEPLVREACETLRQEGDLTVVEAGGRSSVLVAVDSLQGSDVPIDFESISLDFLSPASHPEMLGRLGRYEIEQVIGTGGMGVVLKGYDTELHRVVAIKVLLPHLANSGAARRRFSREAQAAAAVMHDHVIPIYNVETDGDFPYLVMQYVSGESLQARVDEHGPLDVPDILRIGLQAASGLAAAHGQGVVHRDVKPANLLLEESLDRVLISDFGLARTVDDATLTRTGIVAGTPHYMSPEQANGDVVDHRTDLFSLGCVLYFMATGRPPFRADSPMAILNRICHEPHRPVDEVNPAIPVELADLIERLLAKTPAGRYATASEVGVRLSNILSDLQQGGRLRRRGWWRQWSRVARGWRKGAQLASAGAACILIGVLISRIGPARPSPDGGVAAASAATAPSPAGSVPSSGRSLLGPGPGPDTFDADLAATKSRLQEAEFATHFSAPQPPAVPDRWERDRQALEQTLETLLGKPTAADVFQQPPGAPEIHKVPQPADDVPDEFRSRAPGARPPKSNRAP